MKRCTRMAKHKVDIAEGGEYKGERYVICLSCSETYDGCDIMSLIRFLERHGVRFHCGGREGYCTDAIEQITETDEIRPPADNSAKGIPYCERHGVWHIGTCAQWEKYADKSQPADNSAKG